MTETNAERLSQIKNNWNSNIQEAWAEVNGTEIEWLIEQAERAQELDDRIQNMILPEIANGYEQNMQFREALEFYADRENYNEIDIEESAIAKDLGSKARQAIVGVEQNGN